MKTGNVLYKKTLLISEEIGYSFALLVKEFHYITQEHNTLQCFVYEKIQFFVVHKLHSRDKFNITIKIQ